MHGEAVLRRELLDQASHFSVADDGEFRKFLRLTEELPVQRFYRADHVRRQPPPD